MSTPSICLLTDQKCGTDRTNKERKKEKSTLQWDQQNFEILDRKNNSSDNNMYWALEWKDITDCINAKHRVQEFSLSIQIWNAKFVLAWSVNWAKDY